MKDKKFKNGWDGCVNNKFVIFSCGFNCQQYAEKNVKSVRNQTYKNYRHVVIDDASDVPIELDVPMIRNEVNQKWCKNAIDNLIVEDNDIIVLLDLDDWLVSDSVLEILNNVYNKTNAWVVYSDFVYYPQNITSEWIPTYPKEVLKKRDFRRFTWSFTHLRTFKGFLWHNIKHDDLRGPDGEYTKYTYDQAIGFPILEMAGEKHIHHIRQPLMFYNTQNPLQVEKINKKEQQETGLWFRNKKKYPLLKR
jgi:glycosyltransferase involved in cell wall biosynthesis